MATDDDEAGESHGLHRIGKKGSWQARMYNLLVRVGSRHRGPLRGEGDIVRLRRSAARFERLFKLPRDARVRKEERAPVAGRWVEVPESSPQRTLLYLQGSGFVTRTPTLHGALVARICRQARAVAFMPDYRLAPEHPFPAAPEDCLAAFEWLLSLGTDASRIIIAGDSAGGCLALATLFQIRDRGLPLPACAVLLSPATNLAEPSSAYVLNAGVDPSGADWESMQVLFRAYLRGAAPRGPLASPLYGDFRGLPALLFQAGSIEVLVEDTIAAVKKARAAGVDAIGEVWMGMQHVFQVSSFLPESRRAVVHIGDFIATKSRER